MQQRQTTAPQVFSHSPNAIWDEKTQQIIVQKPMPPIHCLALEGGGSRCVAYPGVYKVLKRAGLMDDVLHVSGSSGGAITALAIALGYEIEEAEKILMSMDMEVFLEGYHHWLSASDWWSVSKTLWSVWRNERHSLISGNKFLAWFEELVEKKLGHKQATFADLAKYVESETNLKEKKFKYLYVTGTNLSLVLPECHFFSHETEPDMPLALAVRISASFPFVFEQVKWKNHWYSDGGLIRNLPTAIFDDKRFIPKGYGFTDKGVNPAVLAIKVDSQDELNQLLWRIKKEINLETTSEIVAAVCKALGQNTDTEEIREARMTISLPDKDIGPYHFSVNDYGKLALVTSAELETQNFVENYYQAAYEIKTYPNILSWLDALSLDEVDDVRYAYTNLQTKTVSSSSLKQMLAFLDAYFEFRLIKKRDPCAQLKADVPEQFINLCPKMLLDNWHYLVPQEMEKKRQSILEKIQYMDQRIQCLQIAFIDFPEITPMSCLKADDYFDNVRALTLMVEYRKILAEEVSDLNTKLGAQPDNTMSANSSDFLEKMHSILHSSNKQPLLKAVAFSPFPCIKFDCAHGNGRMALMFDLHDQLDRKIYLLGVRYFLAHHQSHLEESFQALYKQFVAEDVVLPKNYLVLKTALDLDKEQFWMAAYRLEELIHYFEVKFNPKQNPVIFLDQLFGVKKNSFKYTRPYEAEGDIQMTHLISSHSIFAPKSEQLTNKPPLAEKNNQHFEYF